MLFFGVTWFAVPYAELVFVYEGLAKRTTGRPGHGLVAPFFLDESFPESWYGTAFPLAAALGEAVQLFPLAPRGPGGDEGLGNFIPSDLNPSRQTPQQLRCCVLKGLLDVAPDQLDPTIYNDFELYTGCIKGVVVPFFIDNGYFNCNADFVNPKLGESAG